MSQLGRQLSKIGRSTGRQLPSNVQRFGRQFATSVKLVPSAFKDTSKVYSQVEKASRTAGVPVVPELFGFASTGTQAIGDLLSGNFGKAVSGGQKAVGEGGETLTAVAPYFA